MRGHGDAGCAAPGPRCSARGSHDRVDERLCLAGQRLGLLLGDGRSTEFGSSSAQEAAGRLNQNLVKPSPDSAPTLPPNDDTSSATMARPIPAPPWSASRDFSTR